METWVRMILIVCLLASLLGVCDGHQDHHSGSCVVGGYDEHTNDHHVSNGHRHRHHQHGKCGNLDAGDGVMLTSEKLPEELAEEEDMKTSELGLSFAYLYNKGLTSPRESGLHGVGLWVYSMGCSLLVSTVSLVCLLLLPLISVQGKLSKGFVDSLVLFGAGAMLGDAFLHQLPHAFVGGDHSHHPHANHDEQLHSHGLQDSSVGISILGGLLLFVLVDKCVRGMELAHRHLDRDRDRGGDGEGTRESSFVFGYLNLFSDAVHNFTDGMALGSAFLVRGRGGGWSRTLILLAHELPQEVGDFGILLRSGFTPSRALFYNFLSALVALAGTALALVLGRDMGRSSLIEGFTAGGFIYIAVGVIGEMNSGKSGIGALAQLASLLLGAIVPFHCSCSS